MSMVWCGRDGGARRVHASRLPRIVIEELETCVLLSGYDGQQSGRLVALDLPARSADISAQQLLVWERHLSNARRPRPT